MQWLNMFYPNSKQNKRLIIKGGRVFINNKILKKDIYIDNNGNINQISDTINKDGVDIIDANNKLIIPGLVDLHVHLREPGYEYKADIQSETYSAAKGGYTTICCMPNTKPVIDNIKTLTLVKKIIKEKALINVLPYCSITIGQKGEKIVDIPKLFKHCIGFSDDGNDVDSDKVMKNAMLLVSLCKARIVVHCEDKSKKGNLIESTKVKKNTDLAIYSDCHCHVCHVSTRQSIKIIKQARKSGFITCEVTPHHLLLTNTNVKNHGYFKMNPPLATKLDQKALINALKNNIIDVISTDHAPHSEAEKNTTYNKSLNGIIGLEDAFALLYTNLVLKKIITLKKLIELMSVNPAKIFKIENAGVIQKGIKANLTIIDLSKSYVIDKKNIVAKGKASPFYGQKVFSEVLTTICNGHIVYQKN